MAKPMKTLEWTAISNSPPVFHNTDYTLACERRWILVSRFELTFYRGFSLVFAITIVLTSLKSCHGSFSQTTAFDGILNSQFEKKARIHRLVTPSSPTPSPLISQHIWYILVKRANVRELQKRNATFPLQGTKDQLPCEQPCDFHKVHPGNVSCAAGEQSWVHQGYQFPPWPANHSRQWQITAYFLRCFTRSKNLNSATKNTVKGRFSDSYCPRPG